MELKIDIIIKNGERKSYNGKIDNEQQLTNLLWEVREEFKKEKAQVKGND